MTARGWQQAPEQRRIELAEHIREHRRKQCLSVDAIAARAGMSPVTWTRVERGQTVKPITYDHVRKALGWGIGAIEDFLNGGPPPESPEPTESVQTVRYTATLRPVPCQHVAAVLRDWSAEYTDRLKHYPTDVFMADGLTLDAAAARMARHVYALVARELAEAADELAGGES